MSTETNSIISVSVRKAATDAITAYESYDKVKSDGFIAGNALDALPKTPTGKDTKAVKEAKKANLDKVNEARGVYSEAAKRFGRAVRLAVESSNKKTANFASVHSVMADKGFFHMPCLTGKLAETCNSIKAYNKAEKAKPEGVCRPMCDYKHGNYLWFEKHDYVFHNDDTDTYVVIGYRSVDTYAIRYVGFEPVLTEHGLVFANNRCTYGMSMFSHDVLSDLCVNLSAIGSEYGPECVKRLGHIATLIELADLLMTRAPYAEVRNLHPEYDHDAMECVRKGGTLGIYRRTGKEPGKEYRTNVLLHSDELSKFGDSVEHLCTLDLDEEHVVERHDADGNEIDDTDF